MTQSPWISLSFLLFFLGSLSAVEVIQHQTDPSPLDASQLSYHFRVKENDETSAWASNNQQRFTSVFTEKGLQLRLSSFSQSRPKKITSRWRVTSIGQIAVGPGRLESSDRNHIALVRDELGLTEWAVNRPQGLEHGFTLSKKLTSDAEDLVLSTKIEGDLKVKMLPEGSGISLHDRISDEHLLDYTGLKVWDATGRLLNARMEVNETGDLLRYRVADAQAVYPVVIDPTFTISQQAFLKASNVDAGDGYGTSVAVSGTTAVVGAPSESSSSNLINSGEDDNSGESVGAAYVYVLEGGVWTQQAYLKGSNSDTDDLFGTSVAISGDTIVVGANGEASSATGVNGDQSDNSAEFSGAAYVFVRTGTTWTQQAYLKASNTDIEDNFGESVAISGNTIVVGACQEAGGIGGVGADQSDNSQISAGAAYVFVRNGTEWSQQAYLKARFADRGDVFGISVAISGDTIAVGADGESSSSTTINQGEDNNSTILAGAAYVFTRENTVWSQQAFLKPSNNEGFDGFGASVALSGDILVVGATGEGSGASGVNGFQFDNSAPASGAAYVFRREGQTWTQEAYLKASNTDTNDFFGGSVSISGESIAVGASSEGSSATGINGDQFINTQASGAVYLFSLTPSGWLQEAYLKASNTGDEDLFGDSVALSGETLLVGAFSEDSALAGTTIDQQDDSAEDAGAVYVFDVSGSQLPESPIDINGLDGDDPAQVLFNFTTVPGRSYQVRYSSDLLSWSNSPQTIVGDGSSIEWQDFGAPVTSSSPADEERRFYQVFDVTE